MSLDIDRIFRETFIARAEYLPSVGSTNDRAAEWAKRDDCPTPLLVAADHQTAGRGRGTNRWWTGPGALAFSVLVDAPAVGAERNPTPMTALAVALSVAEAVVPLLPNHRVGIHWPNDVMAAERKLAGILIEALPDRRHIIGVGLNLNNSATDAPVELQSTVGTLLDLGVLRHDPTEMMIAVLQHLERDFAALRQAPEQIARRANAICLQRGRTLTLRIGEFTMTGRCLGIDPDGAICLETAQGLKKFHSGTVIDTT